MGDLFGLFGIVMGHVAVDEVRRQFDEYVPPSDPVRPSRSFARARMWVAVGLRRFADVLEPSRQALKRAEKHGRNSIGERETGSGAA